MTKLNLKKVNLFNQLENKIDINLIDSSQYDLQVTVNDSTKYFRIRYFDSDFCAEEIEHNSSIIIPKYSNKNVSINEMKDFCKTNLYKKDFYYKQLFQKTICKDGNNLPSYFVFLQKMIQKNNINNSKIYIIFPFPLLVKEYPLNLLQYVYIMTAGHIELIENFFGKIGTIHNFNELSISSLLEIIGPNINTNEKLRKEFINYFNNKQENINYAYNNKILSLRNSHY